MPKLTKRGPKPKITDLHIKITKHLKDHMRIMAVKEKRTLSSWTRIQLESAVA